MKLYKKKSLDKEFIPYKDGIEFKLDYPNAEQQGKLNEYMFNVVNEATEKGIVLKEGENLPFEKIMLLPSYIKWIKYTCKCAIKDWKGFDERCLVVNNELEDSLWHSLTYDMNQAIQLCEFINQELSVTDTDKKK